MSRHPKQSPGSKSPDDSGQEDSTSRKLLKVAECLYRRGERGKFYAIIKRQGKQFRRCLKTTDRKLAERKLIALRKKIRRINSEISHGIDTFGELADRWFASVKDHYKTRSAERRQLCVKKLKPFFTGTALKGVGFGQCEKWLKERGAELSESSFNQELETLNIIFEFGVTQCALLDNPARNIKRRKLRKAVIVVPTREQFTSLVSTLRSSGARSQDAADLVELLAYSGMRLNEATEFIWSDADFRRGTFRVSGGEAGTKNKKDRIVPLFPDFRVFLEKIRNARLPNAEGSVATIDSAKRAMASACKEAKIPNFTHHSLRHFFVSNAIEAGVDFATIAGWVGHSDGGVLVAKTYGHLRESHSQKMAERMNFGMRQEK